MSTKVRFNCLVPEAQFDYERNISEVAVVRFKPSDEEEPIPDYIAAQCPRCDSVETKPISKQNATLLIASGVEIRFIDETGFTIE